MTAPTGVSSGPAPEPGDQADPDPQAAGTQAAGTQAAGTQTAEPALGPAGPALGAAVPALGAAVPQQATEPVLAAAEPTIATAEPTRVAEEPAGVPRGENAADGPDAGPRPAGEERHGRTSRARGVRLLAVAATVFGILALVGAAVAVLAVVTHGFRPKVEVTYRPAAVFSLRAGECINSSPNGLSVTLRSCTVPHDAEVFATFRLTGTSWPGSTAIQADAGNGCVSRFASYVNPQLANAGFNQEYVFPDQQAWQAGVRTVICEVSAASGQLTGSVRQPG
jgi:putative regulator of septum formation